MFLLKLITGCCQSDPNETKTSCLCLLENLSSLLLSKPLRPKYKTSLLLLCLLSVHACTPSHYQSKADPPSHELFDSLLQKYVDSSGMVRYHALQKDSILLKAYLHELETHPPDETRWSREEQMAYWINAYNAYTLQLICRHYPVKSIKAIKPGISFINSTWDIRFINIGGHRYDLNEIEHNILRKKFNDARIHAAINCASISCPRLSPYAYQAQQLDQQLNQAMRSFLNDSLRNKITKDTLWLSPIFSWFSKDFLHNAGSITAFVKKHSDTPFHQHARIAYLPYDWNLNEKAE